MGLDLSFSGRKPLPNERWRGLYTDEDVRRLRVAPPLTRWALADDSVQPPPREPDPQGEARRQEIIAAHDAWAAAKLAVDERTGLMAAALAALAAGEAWEAAHDAVAACPVRTLEGLARKGAWMAARLRADGDVGLGEVFARQVAAFGGAES